MCVWFVLCTWWATLLLGLAVWCSSLAGEKPTSNLSGVLLFLAISPFTALLLIAAVLRFFREEPVLPNPPSALGPAGARAPKPRPFLLER